MVEDRRRRSAGFLPHLLGQAAAAFPKKVLANTGPKHCHALWQADYFGLRISSSFEAQSLLLDLMSNTAVSTTGRARPRDKHSASWRPSWRTCTRGSKGASMSHRAERQSLAAHARAHTRGSAV